MIEKTQSFKTSTGKIFGSIDEAKTEELKSIMASNANLFNTPDGVGLMAECLLANSEKVVDILTTKGSSHVKARKANGATRKPRVATPQIQPAGEKK